MLRIPRPPSETSFMEFGSKTILTFAAIVGLVIVIAGLISGIGILASLFTFFVIGLVIYLGSIFELAGSIVVGSLLKLFSAEIQSFATVWWTGESAKMFFDRVNSTGYFSLIVVVFFAAYTISFFTSRIKLVNVRNETTAKSRRTDD